MVNIGSNTELITLLKKGNILAFESIYNLYCSKLHKFVLMYLKQEEDAEEIVQEVFIKIWQNKDKIDNNASFEPFLFTIAYNATISLLRKRVNANKSKEYIKSLQHNCYGNPIIEEIQFKELDNTIQSLLEKLTPRQKEIYYLSRVEELSHTEIASKLNISESTVNNHLVNILRYLKTSLKSKIEISA
jgi:RNA polymerase sigma-70 factor, ECF subfamily